MFWNSISGICQRSCLSPRGNAKSFETSRRNSSKSLCSFKENTFNWKLHIRHFRTKVFNLQNFKPNTQRAYRAKMKQKKNTIQSNFSPNWPSSRVFLRNSKSGAPDNKVSVSPNWPYFRWLWFQRLARQLPPISTRISSANTTARKDFCSKWVVQTPNIFLEPVVLEDNHLPPNIIISVQHTFVEPSYP